MKKILIGIAAMSALIATPALAGSLDSSWEVIEDTTDTARQVVLVAGLADELDTCGNGKPFYTVFLPVDLALDDLFDEMDLTIADLSATPAVVSALLNDHIARGSYAYSDLMNASITRIITRSGYLLTKSIIGGSVYVNSNLIVDSVQTCNGFIHRIDGVIDSTAQVPTTGVDVDVAPAPTNAPVESGLPDTL